jgi:hypothetical protein
MIMEDRTPTRTFTDVIQTAPLYDPEARTMRAAIAATLKRWKGTGGVTWVLVDSEPIAAAIVKGRKMRGEDPDPRQALDYVQHMLREAEHVCRHAEGTCYRLHNDPECGPTCTMKYDQAKKRDRRPSCRECFTELTTDFRCPMGCEDE